MEESSIDSIRTEVDYLESLTNYLILQLMEKGVTPNLSVGSDFPTQIVLNSINTIDNYLNASKIDKNCPFSAKSNKEIE